MWYEMIGDDMSIRGQCLSNKKEGAWPNQHVVKDSLQVEMGDKNKPNMLKSQLSFAWGREKRERKD